MKERKTYCFECDDITEYTLRKVEVVKTIRDKEYKFVVTKAFCVHCNEEMSPNGLADYNVQEIDLQYREAENIVSVKEIKNLMAMYKIGKNPLSLALGFGEITIPRYLIGQVPSKEYSDVIRSALTSVSYMRRMLESNKNKVGETAYKKSIVAIQELEELFGLVSPKLLRVIAFVFSCIEEITPLMLQKLLYYIQGIYKALYGTAIFDERCEAWVHGPVYPNVYNLFKSFKYNPIDDERFILLQGYASGLNSSEKKVILMVVNSFGMYSGKTLEAITHKESPWLKAREGLLPNEYSDIEIPSNDIDEYFNAMKEQYVIETEEGLKKYINDMTR